MNAIELPDRWPVDFPLPPGQSPVRDESDATVIRVVFRGPPHTDLRTFFDRELA